MGRFVALLAGALAIAAFLYGAFLLGAVAHAAGRTAAEREVGRLGAEVSRLESTYLTETKELSLERAAAMGTKIKRLRQDLLAVGACKLLDVTFGSHRQKYAGRRRLEDFRCRLRGGTLVREDGA